MRDCIICNKKIEEVDEMIVLCEYRGSFIHMDCCINQCSQHKLPCVHSMGVYGKLK